MNKRFYDFIGLATKANKVLAGTAACLTGLKYNRIYLLVIDNNTSEKTKKEFAYKCKIYDIPMVITNDDKLLGYSVGKPKIKVIGLVDKKLAEQALIKFNMCSGGMNIG